MGFDADWLAARAPYDEAALDRSAIEQLRAWGIALPDGYVPVVVDLGSGTGAALHRARRWLEPRRVAAFAVDQDTELLARIADPGDGSTVTRIVGDCLQPLETLGGPPDGTVDLVVGHALADLLPLDRLAARVAALLRPGGLAHLALTYDGLTAFSPAHLLDHLVLAAFHRDMNRPGRSVPHHGGSTAGRRVGPALSAAGLQIERDTPSIWQVRADDGDDGVSVLRGLLRFVRLATGGEGRAECDVWQSVRLTTLERRLLTATVRHRDVLARKPDR